MRDRAMRHRLVSHTHCWWIAWLATTLLSACAHGPTSPYPVDCSGSQGGFKAKVDYWQEHTVAGMAQLTARDGLLRSRAMAALVVAPPDRLRLEVIDDFGQTQLLALVVGKTLGFWTAEGGWRSGPPDLVDLPLPEEVWSHLPLLIVGLPCRQTTCSPEGSAARGEPVLLACEENTALIHWSPLRQRVAEVLLPSLRIVFREPQEGKAELLSDFDVIFEDGRMLSLRWQRLTLNPPLARELFDSPLP